MKLIIHAGMGKTGTTAIQGAFAQHKEELREVGILYPDAGRAGDAHHRFFLSFVEKALIRDDIKPLVETEGHLVQQVMLNEIYESNAETVVLSSEFLDDKRLFQSENLYNISKLFRTFDLYVLICFRRHSEDLQSTYAQWVTGPQAKSYSPSEHFSAWKRSGRPMYSNRLTEFESAFQSAKIVPYLYSSVKFDIFEPFWKIANIRPKFSVKLERSNTRRSWITVAAMRNVNKVITKPSIRQRLRTFIEQCEKPLQDYRFYERLNKDFAPYDIEFLKEIDEIFSSDLDSVFKFSNGIYH